MQDQALVMTVSYSGDTEETLSSFVEAVERGCMTFSICSGGLLEGFSHALGLPYMRIPSGYPPRSAVPYVFFPMVAMLQKLGLLNTFEDEASDAVKALKDTREEISSATPTEENPSKKLALALEGLIPMVCGFGPFEAVTTRMKTQFNENSKTWAFHEAFSELNHNAVVGYLYPSRARQVIFVVLLHSTLLHPRNQLRYQATMELLKEARISYERVEAQGEGFLAQVLNLLLFGDYVSFYLAILNHMDPTPIVIIDELKKAIALGIAKINIDTDLRLAFTAAVREVLASSPKEFDPRKILGPAKEAMKEFLPKVEAPKSKEKEKDIDNKDIPLNNLMYKKDLLFRFSFFAPTSR
jgi:glucose/mannose-6-phosphate isomerase